MGFFNIREPKRPDSTATQQVEVICDLDAIVEKRAAFTLNGVTHFIKPVTTQSFVIWVTKLAELKKLTDPDAVRKHYVSMVQEMCPSVTEETINGLTQQQSLSLFAAICDKVMGKVSDDTQKKSP